MVLDKDLIAEITKGKWYNLPEKFSFSGLNFNINDLCKNDLFVTRSVGQFKELKVGNENQIEKIIQKEPAAIIIREGIKRPNYPCLVVKNTKEALKQIAVKTREIVNTTRVLVTGSYGKTGFKIRLAQLIKDCKKTKIIPNSANEDSGVYKALASLDKEDEVTIIEVGGSMLSRATRRSKAVQPNICVITSIGHEDIYQHKTIDNTIYNKASVTKYLTVDGICIIKKDKYYDRMCKAINEHNPNTIIKSVGETSYCEAYIIEKNFNDFGWDIKASIEGIEVEYRIPFMDYHSIEASLLELLTAKCLGIDIIKIVSRYEKIKNFESSGKFYNIQINQKDFLLVDQSHRGGIENYESFFKTVSYIKPKNNGRKILLTSAFVDHEDNEMDNINPNSFKSLIQNGGFDAIFTTEYFSDHLEVLPDKSLWKRHKFNYKDIRDDVLNYIGSDDVLFVKGIFESRLRGFLPYIKSFKNSQVKEYSKKEHLDNVGKKITLEDMELYKNYLVKTDNKTWCYYFPFLYFFAKAKNKELYFEEIDGSLVVYFLRNAHKEDSILELFFPPIPMNETVLKKVQQKIYDFRGKKLSNILWIDEVDKELVSKYFRTIKREEEYIFSFDQVKDLKGSTLKNLRYNLKRFSKIQNVEIREYNEDDYFECLSLLKEWRRKQQDKYDSIDDLDYTKNCLRFYGKFSNKDLFGKVVLIDNKIKAFGFAGEIYENVANLFIIKADPNIRGLAYFIKYKILEELKEYKYVNDASDLGYKGLQESKKSFNPTSMHKVYKARDGF